MVWRQDRKNLEAKQRVIDETAPRFAFCADDHVGLAVRKQTKRIGMEAGNEIELHMRPTGAKSVHYRHQPFKAGVAFESNAQRAYGFGGDPGHVALGCLDFAKHGLR